MDDRTQPALDGVAIQLFADDVDTTTLPLSITIAREGGMSVVMIPRDTALPTGHRETFSTATENQGSIDVHVYIGERAFCRDNLSVGRFSIVDIPDAPAGLPLFEVSFEVDEQRMFRLSATNIATGEAQPMLTVDSLATPLTAATLASIRARLGLD